MAGASGWVLASALAIMLAVAALSCGSCPSAPSIASVSPVERSCGRLSAYSKRLRFSCA
jgi:hypothetical protein